MLEVRELCKDYRSGKQWNRAVDHLSFQIHQGEIVGLIGPNGAGKTTALRCIGGIIGPTSGQILINGFDVVEDQSKAKQGLAYVPEVPSLYELLTVEEHLRFVAMCFDTIEEFERRVDELLERYSLSDKRGELVATLSKGMKQKLSIACAMVHRANMFLFDEPLIGIDPEGVAEIKAEFFRQRDAGASILVSTHLLDTAERLCDRILILRKGQKLFEGSMEELRSRSGQSDATLERLFLDLTRQNTSNEAPPVSGL